MQMEAGFLEVKGKAFEPEKEGVPVDEQDDPEGDEGVPERECEEVGRSQGGAFSGQGADQHFFRSLIVIDADVQVRARRLETKIEFPIQVGERGDVEQLGGSEVKGAVAPGDKVGFEFGEGVAHLGDGTNRRAVRPKAKPEGNRIKDVAKKTGVGDEEDAGGFFRDPVPGQEGLGVLAGRAGDQRKMVPVAEFVHTRGVVVQEGDLAGQDGEFVEVEGKQKDPVVEFVGFGKQTPVKDVAFVEAGIHGGRRGSFWPYLRDRRIDAYADLTRRYRD